MLLAIIIAFAWIIPVFGLYWWNDAPTLYARTGATTPGQKFLMNAAYCLWPISLIIIIAIVILGFFGDTYERWRQSGDME